jgi:hypothetical protein
MPAKKLKSNIPEVTDLAREDVEVVRGLLRDKQDKVIGTSETFDRILPRDRNGIVEITTSIDNFGKKLSEIDSKELNFKRLVWKK